MSDLLERRASRMGLVLIVLAGIVTLSLSTVDTGRWSRAPSSTVPPPAALQVLLEEGSQERHSMYAALRSQAAGARIILDTLEPGSSYRLYLFMLGGVSQVDEAPLPGDWVPERAPDATGALRNSGWALYREPGPVDTLLLGLDEGRTVLVDRRSIPEGVQQQLALPRWEPVVPIIDPSAPSFARAVTVETALLVALMLMGGLVLPRRAAPGMARPALALLAGAGVQATTAYVFLLGRPAMLVGPAVAVAVGVGLHRRGVAAGWGRQDLRALLAGTAALTVVVTAVRHFGVVVIGADQVQHIARSIAMGAGLLGLSELDEKRPLAVAAIHAPAHVLGIEGIHALSWALLAAAAAIIVLLPRLLAPADRPARKQMLVSTAVSVFAALLALALFRNPLVGAVTSSVGTSILVAVMLLLLVVLWARTSDSTPTPMSTTAPIAGIAPVVIVSLLAIIVTRAEAVLIVGLVLLATLVGRDRPMTWPWAWPAVGLGLAAWNGLHILAGNVAGGGPSFPVLAITGAGVLIAVAGPVLRRIPDAARGALPWAVGLTIWGFVLALALTPIGATNRVLEAVSVNIGEGAGGWGVLAPILAVAVIVALVANLASPDRRLVLPLWIMLGAFPSVIIAQSGDGTDGISFDDPEAAIARILSSGARIGSWGDSANRMWTHFAVVAVAFIVMTVVVASRRPARDVTVGTDGGPREVGSRDGGSQDGGSTRGGGRRVLATGAAAASGLAAIGVVLATWSPGYLGPAGPQTIEVIEQRDTGTATAELTATTRIERDIAVPAIDIPDDAEGLSVCATYRFTDLDRVNWGTTRYGLDGEDASAAGDFGVYAWSGERERTVCLEQPKLREGPSTVTAWVSGDGRALPGSSAAVRTDADGGPVTTLDVRYLAASEDPRSLPMRVASRVLRLAMQAGPAVVTVLLGTGLLLLRRRA